jgi:N-acetylmuramoyl-L-alanine amidase
MRLRIFLSLTAGAMLIAPTAASADYAHTVVPGETLTSIAAADGLSIGQVAAANDISPYTELITGTTVMIPPQDSSDVASGTTGSSEEVSTPSSSSSGGGSSYVVQPGDTLWSIAEREGTSVDALAAANGLDPSGLLLSGITINLSGSSGGTMTDAASSQPVGPAAEGSVTSPPYPTQERVSASEVGQIAASEGVPSSLAEAIAYQESGFNNDLVSGADARGVMQILPGTWQWVSQSLATPPPPDPSSAAGNIRAGTLLLHSLLAATGGNEALAAAGYYQGLPSVQQNGEYTDTQQYVNDVMSLAQQFGGG